MSAMQAMIQGAWAAERRLPESASGAVWLQAQAGLVVAACVLAVGLAPLVVAWVAVGLLR